ncbi:DUF2155 domain-containing protein [Aquicoccus sp. SCR17]|nr:DUF2155 domain-containing protein [Carideicomes alvinocaridis]
MFPTLLLSLATTLAPAILPAQEEVSQGGGAVLRSLDKVNGEVVDLELIDGQEAVVGSIAIELDECRYPAGNPAGDAYAYLVIRDTANPEPPAFSGWMVASSPALNALDHSRYDVWVLRCTTS